MKDFKKEKGINMKFYDFKAKKINGEEVKMEAYNEEICTNSSTFKDKRGY